jgi:hypothetical protein
VIMGKDVVTMGSQSRGELLIAPRMFRQAVADEDDTARRGRRWLVVVGKTGA